MKSPNVKRIYRTLPKLTPEQYRKVRKLTNRCCNKDRGNCLLLDHGEYVPCMQHTAQKSIRGRLMSYFSQCAKQSGSNTFKIPYNRQQLADYLNVDRSALCSELFKM